MIVKIMIAIPLYPLNDLASLNNEWIVKFMISSGNRTFASTCLTMQLKKKRQFIKNQGKSFDDWIILRWIYMNKKIIASLNVLNTCLKWFLEM